MTATLTELHRKPGKLVRPVIDGKRKLTTTEDGQPCVETVPVPTVDREKAISALRAIGPVPLPRRK